jgi:hypothetical protein
MTDSVDTNCFQVCTNVHMPLSDSDLKFSDKPETVLCNMSLQILYFLWMNVLLFPLFGVAGKEITCY